MKKLIFLIPLMVLVGFIGFLSSYPTSGGSMGGSAIMDSLNNAARAFDSTLTANSKFYVKDSTFLSNALVCSTDAKIIDDLYVKDSTFLNTVVCSNKVVVPTAGAPIEIDGANARIECDGYYPAGATNMIIAFDQPEDNISFIVDRVGGEYRFWSNTAGGGQGGLAFKISNAKWDSTVWGRRDSIDVYKRLILKNDGTAATIDLRGDALGEKDCARIQSGGMCEAHLDFLISNENPVIPAWTTVLKIYEDSIRAMKPLILDSLDAQHVVADGHIQTDSSYTEHGVVNTGLMIGSSGAVVGKWFIRTDSLFLTVGTDSFPIPKKP